MYDNMLPGRSESLASSMASTRGRCCELLVRCACGQVPESGLLAVNRPHNRSFLLVLAGMLLGGRGRRRGHCARWARRGPWGHCQSLLMRATRSWARMPVRRSRRGCGVVMGGYEANGSGLSVGMRLLRAERTRWARRDRSLWLARAGQVSRRHTSGALAQSPTCGSLERR